MGVLSQIPNPIFEKALWEVILTAAHSFQSANLKNKQESLPPERMLAEKECPQRMLFYFYFPT